jgi:pyridoxine 4-dehydrogenase
VVCDPVTKPILFCDEYFLQAIFIFKTEPFTNLENPPPKTVLNGVKKVDIFGPARSDSKTSIEETMNELKALVTEGKIGGVGLSEVGPETIRKAHAIMPLSMVEEEFSLWSDEVLSNGVGATCKELGIPIVAYSPLGRGFLTGELRRVEDIPAGDIRTHFDRFQPEVC